MKPLPDLEEKISLSLHQPSSAGCSPMWHVHCYDEASSTMDVAREYMQDLPINTPLLVLALSQTAGRGRRGKSWHNSTGALYVTIGLTTKKAPSELRGFSLVVGYALQNIFKEIGCETRLKWPNDVLALDGKKLSGVLIEVMSQDKVTLLLTGIGVNVLKGPSEITHGVSLYELCGKDYSLEHLAPRVASKLLEYWYIFEGEGFLPFQKRWNELCISLNKEVEVEYEGKPIKGICLGVNTWGALVLEKDGKQIEIVSGEVLV